MENNFFHGANFAGQCDVIARRMEEWDTDQEVQLSRAALQGLLRRVEEYMRGQNIPLGD